MQYKAPFQLLLLALCCIFLGGCKDITESVGKYGTTFSYQWWVPLLAFLFGGTIVCLGIALRNQPARHGWPVALIGLGFILVVVPGIIGDRIHVSDYGFEASGGVWGTAPRVEVAFDNLKSVRVAYESHVMGSSGVTGSNRFYVLYFKRKDGGTAKLELTNDVRRAAGDRIVRIAKREGIRIIRGRGVKYIYF